MALSVLKNKKLILLILLSMLCLLLAYRFILYPLTNSADQYDELAARQQQHLQDLQALKIEYTQLSAELQALRTSFKYFPQDYTLIAYVENALKRMGLAKYLASFSPGTTRTVDDIELKNIEVSFQGIPLPQFLSFIKFTESTGYLLKVTDCRLKKEINDTFDAVITIETASLPPAS